MITISIRKCMQLRSTYRNISNFVEIKELPKHVTQDMIMNKINEYGNVVGIKLFDNFNKDSKRVTSVKIHFRYLTSAISFMDELNRSVMFGNRVDLAYFYPPPQYFKARLYGLSASAPDNLIKSSVHSHYKPLARS